MKWNENGPREVLRIVDGLTDEPFDDAGSLRENCADRRCRKFTQFMLVQNTNGYTDSQIQIWQWNRMRDSNREFVMQTDKM